MSKYVIPLAFRETVKKHGLKESLGQKKENSGFSYITYNNLGEKVNQFASSLIDLGLKPGDKLALMSENSPEWVMTDLGAMTSGIINVPVYPTLTYTQLEYILENCGAKGIVVSNNTHYQKVAKLFDKIKTLEFVIYVDSVDVSEHKKIKSISFNDILSEGKKSLETNSPEIEKRINSIKEDDLCSIIYTSGTTGNPKGVMLSHKNFMSNATEAAKILLAGEKDHTELSFLPLSHVLERIVYYVLVVVSGYKIAYAESIDKISANMLEVKPTIVASVPRIYEKIYNKVMDGVRSAPPLRQKIFTWALKVGQEHYEAQKYGKGLSFLLEFEHKLATKLVFSKIQAKTGGNIRTFASGGAPLMKELAEFFCYIGLPILEGYGLTETSPVISFNRPESIRFGTVGQALPGVEIKIAEDGEILAKGPNIMKGYYNNKKATDAAIDKDGWFHTGDIGELDNENFLKITDRKKELIIMSNGKNVAPQPIENLLKTSGYIEQIATIGDKRKYMSALIVPNFEALYEKAKELNLNFSDNEELIKSDKIISFMRKEIDNISKDKLARYETIKKFSLLPREFILEKNEITPTLKLKRKVINENFSEEIASMYQNEELVVAK